MTNSSITTASDDSSRSRDLSGDTIGDYQILRRIGRGGMAEVYLATQTSLQRRVAFKVLHPNLASDPVYVKRFQNEARSAASLVNANIVQIHEVGCINGLHFIVQEYVSGQNLKQLLDKQGPVSVGVAMNIIRQSGAALHKASQAGIVHRDIKPENIMLSRDGEVKVADFGLSRIVEKNNLNLTQDGMTMGTPLYMSPEQVEGKAVDFRSDLYSFGVTCFHMLAGEPPFHGESALNVAVQHIKDAPPQLEDLRPDLPPGLCKIVHKLLSKKPDDRYDSAASMLRDLRALGLEADSSWPTDLEKDWSTSEMMAIADARFDATQQLQAVLDKPARKSTGSLRWLAVVAVTLLAFAVGCGAAWISRPENLLAFDAAKLPEIEKQATAQDQYVYAMLDGSEEALKSVAKHFPAKASSTNTYYGLMAKRRLGELYLATRRLDEALLVFHELERSSENDPSLKEFRAHGLAGQIFVMYRKGDTAKVQQLNQKLAPYWDELEQSTKDQLQRLVERRRTKPAA